VKSLVTSEIIGELPACRERARLAGGADGLTGGREGPRTRSPVMTLSPVVALPSMTARLPIAAMRAWLSGAAVLVMGSQLRPSSEIQKVSTAFGWACCREASGRPRPRPRS